MTISWVADEKPSSTAARAIMTIFRPPMAGLVLAIQTMAMMMKTWAKSSHERRLPSRRVSSGRGIRSTSGAQMNLKE